jgi:hypothetical protein
MVAGTLTRSRESAGGDRVIFSGRIGRRALAPRSYLAVLVARNSAGRSAPATVPFTVLR